MRKRIVAMGLLMTALTVLVFLGYQAAAEPDANAGATPGESAPSSDLRAKIAEARDAGLHGLLAEDEAEAERSDDAIQRAKVAAGPNANATLSLDLIPNGGSGNQRNDAVTSGTVSGQGTKIAIEVFATGVTTSLTGMRIRFDFDATVLTFVKAENSAFTFPIRASTGTDFAALSPVTLPSSGFLTRAEFTTATNVTGREFSIGIASVTLSENAGSSDVITTTNRIAFNATTARTPDFDGNGAVDFFDFLAFVGQYDTRQGDGRYQVKYDLNSDGAIDFQDFLIFVSSYDSNSPVSPPDLIVELPSVRDSTLRPGQTFTLRATVRNSGTGQSAATTLRYYLSSDDTISTGDAEVGTDSVSVLAASGTSAEDIDLKTPLSSGTYYYGACVAHVSGESNTDNNCSDGVGVTVSRSNSGGSNNPDLIVELPSVRDSTLRPGQTFTLRATVRNSGTGQSAATTLRYYLSSDDTISTGDAEVGTDSVSVLAASGTSAEDIDLKTPLSSGTYYYGACVAHVSGESNTDNNCSDGVGVTVSRPDLIVESPSVSDSTLTPGQSFTLRATVRNSDTGSAAATTLRYYRSSNSSISTSDTEVGMDAVSGLSASGTSAESISLTASSSAGTYYYGACVESVSGESNTNNNCSAGVGVTVSSGGVGGICGRTPQVRDAILEQIAGVTDCAQVTKTHLTGLRDTLNIRRKGLTALQTADFNDLSNLRVLRLGSNDSSLTALPDDIFLGLSNLQDLQLGGNGLDSLNADVFSNLSNLRKLDLSGNDLKRLPNGVFSNLSNLQVCLLYLNELSSLPDSVFSGLSRLKGLNLELNPGAPFPLTLSLERTDNANLLASSPATVQLKVDKGAPFDMSISLSVTGGSLSQSTGTIAAGSTESRGITVRQSGGNLVRVGVLSVSEVPEDYKGLQISQPDRIVSLSLFATSSDLVVESPSVSDSTLTPGQSFILRATVRNSGNSGTGSVAETKLRYYRSTDATISTSDTAVGTADAISGLAASATSADSVSLTAPTSAGMYYYGACVESVSGESDTNNNCSTGVQVTVGAPDLVVESPSVDDTTPTPSQSLTLRATVRNQGTGAAAATKLLYYRSSDATISTSDTAVGTADVGGLSASNTSVDSVSLTAPSAGMYYYGACVESVSGESDTNNNCSTGVQVTVGAPDLVVESPSVDDTTPTPSQSLTLRATVRNQGTGAAAATKLLYYRSSDATISKDDTEVGMASVSGLSASNTSVDSVSLTAPSAGMYYYGACVESVSGESDTNNNCSTGVQVTVGAPDLVVESPSVDDTTPTPSQSLTLRATVRNQGTGAAAATKLLYYRSSDATISTSDTAVGTADVGGLSASNTSVDSVSLTAPSAGMYYYGACVESVSGESDTNNNCSTGVQVTVGPPDLVVESPSVDDTTPTPSQSLTLRATVRNQGTGAAAATKLLYYRSSDATISKDDTEVGMASVSGLSASNTSVDSVSLTAPTSAGMYYYGACVESVSGESDTNNNCSTGVQVTVGAPDLVVESPSVDDTTPTPSQSLTLRATVRNQGTGAAAATKLLYYRSSDATISTSDTAVGTADVGGLSASNTSVDSVSLTAPSAGMYYYGACVESVSGESDTNNNCSTGVQVTVGAPDLVVESPSVDDTTPTPSQSLTLRATVRNQGTGAAAATKLLYYRSSDATISKDDTEVGMASVSGLSASNTSVDSVSLTAPSAGMYYYGACVESVSGESDTNNNCSTGVQVTVGAPDLVVESPSVDDTTPTPSQSLTLRATVRNQGTGAAAATKLLYYRSSDATISTSDTAVGTADVGGLSASNTSVDSVSLTAPSAGMYYYGACVESVSGESDTNNNCSTGVQVTVGPPDLVVESPSVDDTTPTPSQSLTLRATVRNQGTGAAAATKLLYYRSSDATISKDDTEVGMASVSGLSASNTSVDSVSLTAPTSAGMYYYGACVESVSGESDTNNNCSTGVQVTVGAPDLVVESPSVDDTTPTPSQSLTLRTTVRNQGTGAAAATKLLYYRSSDATISTSDTAVGTADVGGLSASNTSVDSVSLTAPSAGMYYYGACVESVSGESDTNNNCSTGVQVTVGAPDLVVESPSVDDTTPTPSQSLTLRATVRNQGTGAAAATKLLYYRSSDATISKDDTEVGMASVSGLSASNTSVDSVSLTAPSAGMYYYGACVESVSGESDTNNNCSTGVQVTVGAPDLVVESPSVDDTTPTPSQSLTLRATVRNQGTGAAAATKLLYYRSSDATISTSDTAVGTDDAISGLSASATSAQSSSVTAPSSSGTYYYGACVESVSGETDTNNNCSTGVQVKVGAPDLVVESPSVDNTTPNTGQSLTLSATVRNQGTAAASATTLRYYRSSDATISTSDTEVGTDAVSGLSASNTSVESVSLTAPSSAGTYYYGACVESVSGETNTSNNCSSAVTVTVSLPYPKMYWTNKSTIRRANLNGSNVEILYRGWASARAIALDVNGGKMYWGYRPDNAEKIQRANLDGSNVEDLVTTGLRGPMGIALDVGRGKMYWTDSNNRTGGEDKIQRANLDGSNVETLVTTGLQYVIGIALDVGSSKMYWADANARKIQRANLDGSNVETLVTESNYGASGIALDVGSSKMYWTSNNKIRRANLNGSNVETLVTTDWPNANDIALDVGSGKMYWTNFTHVVSTPWGRVQRANLDGSNVETLVTVEGEWSSGIALDTRE